VLDAYRRIRWAWSNWAASSHVQDQPSPPDGLVFLAPLRATFALVAEGITEHDCSLLLGSSRVRWASCLLEHWTPSRPPTGASDPGQPERLLPVARILPLRGHDKSDRCSQEPPRGRFGPRVVLHGTCSRPSSAILSRILPATASFLIYSKHQRTSTLAMFRC